MKQQHELGELLRALTLALNGAQLGTDGLEELVDWDALKALVLHVQDVAESLECQLFESEKELKFQRRERDRMAVELETVKRLTHRDAERMNRLLVFAGKFRYILNFRHGERDEHLQDLWCTLSGEDAELAVMSNREHEAPKTTEESEVTTCDA